MLFVLTIGGFKRFVCIAVQQTKQCSFVKCFQLSEARKDRFNVLKLIFEWMMNVQMLG